MIITPPTYSNGWLDTYISETKTTDLLSELMRIKDQTVSFYTSVAPEKWDHRYAPGKWTIIEILGHLIDSERVFSYRALRFSRNDKTELPGYDEQLFVANANSAIRTIDDITHEYRIVRDATIALYRSFSEEMLDRSGIANNTEMSVRGLGYAIAGHELHHLRIIRERYL